MARAGAVVAIDMTSESELKADHLHEVAHRVDPWGFEDRSGPSGMVRWAAEPYSPSDQDEDFPFSATELAWQPTTEHAQMRLLIAPHTLAMDTHGNDCDAHVVIPADLNGKSTFRARSMRLRERRRLIPAR
ncbi:hypothetical protein [Rhodococcus opacus]|uniref:hypothetical protein n=1 Tax=Rhodococcus opacus TaxID=37919 RepID=UPI001F5A4FB6|nr:hypothetical protein [Rhodococcus opacus]UNN05015.1 hypothetical protein MOO23_39320 [Rhodococcus opacus]